MPRTGPSEIPHRPFPFWQLLSVIALVCASGCYVVEKRTVVIDLADTTDEIRILYLDEGISVPAESPPEEYVRHRPAASLEGYVKLLPNNALLKHTEFEDPTYYIDPSRDRPLCAEQRVTISRGEILALLNALFQEQVKEFAKEPTESIMEGLKSLQTEEAKRAIEDQEIAWREQLKIFGLEQFAAWPKAGLTILEHLDEASIDRAKAAIEADHVWFRKTPGSIELLIPVTADCARRMADDKNAKQIIAEVQRVVSPVTVEARADGFAIVLGGKDKALRSSVDDKRAHDARHDAAMFDAHGGKEMLELYGLHRDGTARIDQFLRRSSALRRIWKSADGRFEVDATLEELKGEVVTLKRIDDERLFDVKLGQLHADDQAWLKSEAERTNRFDEIEKELIELDKQREEAMKRAKIIERDRLRRRRR